MPRLRPRRVFAASIVTIAGCGVFEGAPTDAAPPPDVEEIDCEEDPYGGNCNPPEPWWEDVDAAPATCITWWPDESCMECTPSSARPIDASICTAAVCATDPTCCTTIWDERCVDLADASCPEANCAGLVGVGGHERLALARWTGTGFEVSVTEWWSFGRVESVAFGARYGAATREVGLMANGFSDYWFYPPSGGDLEGRRARWADLSGDGALDLVVAGGRGAIWNGGSFTYEIAPPEHGWIGDFAIVDLDDDGTLELLVGFLDGNGLRVYRRAPSGWARDPAPIGPDARTVELCDLVGDGRREVMLVEADGISAHELVDGVAVPVFPELAGAFVDATCGDVDGDGKEEVIATRSGGAVIIADATGEITWTALEPLLGSGVDTGDLDHDGDVDLVVSETGADARIHVYWNRGEAPLAFDHLEGPILGAELGRLDLTW